MLRTLRLVPLALLLAGCSLVGGNDSSDQARSVDTVPPADEATPEPEVIENELPGAEEALEDALLTEDDLPLGFTEAGSDTESEETEMCPQGGQSLEIEALTGVEATFEAEGAFIGHGIERYQAGEASQEMQLVRDEVAACEGSVTIEGEPATIAPIMFPAAGDDTVAFQLEQTNDGVPVTMHLIGVRNGDLVSVLFLGGIGDVDAQASVDLTQLAQERLAGIPI